MALIRMNFFSNELGMCVPATVLLPQRTPEQTQAGQLHPVLWLLHGASGDHTDWTRFTSIERYADRYGLAVVMPSAHMSRYRDMAHGQKFYSYIADELPRAMRGFFPLSPDRARNYLCGLSMGGQGALRIALTRPEQYAAIGCLSAGASNYRADQMDDFPYAFGMKLVFGERDPATEMAEVLDLARAQARAGGPLPRVYHTCGDDDFLLPQAHQTRDLFQSLPGNPYGYRYEQHPGAHTWSYWDEHIQRFLKFAIDET